MLIAKLVTSFKELDQIADLSRENLVTNISAETKAKEGFVTWQYSADALRALHAIAPSVIVTDGKIVAGYALTLTHASALIYPPMRHSLEHISSLEYRDRKVGDSRFYLMGQICVGAAYRGRGVVEQLYRYHHDHFSPRFDLLATEISTSNPRSLRAHQKVGFEVINTYRDDTDQWNVVVWDWGAQ
jgi:RimJ/RimL family protein N-acetyltransferase